MKNNFEQLEDVWNEEYGPAPNQIRENITESRQMFGFVGDILELFVPKILELFVGLLGGKTKDDKASDDSNYPNL